MNFNFNTPGAAGGGNPFVAAVGGIVGLIIWLVVLVFMLYVWARIFHKAGYSGWLALLLLIPLVNIGLIIWFGFAHWPVEHEAMMARSTPPPGYTPPGYQQQPPPERPGGYPGGQPTPQH